MSHEGMKAIVKQCVVAIRSNIIDAENALCHILAVGDFAERLKGYAHEESFAIIQRNALANLILSIHKSFEGEDNLTLCRLTRTVEAYMANSTLPIDSLVHDYLLEWLRPDLTLGSEEADAIKNCAVGRLLIQATRKMSPRGNSEMWKRFDVLRNSVAHNCANVSAEGHATLEELVRYLDFLVGSEHAFRYGLFGFDTKFTHPRRCVADFRRKKAYKELSKVIEDSLASAAS